MYGSRSLCLSLLRHEHRVSPANPGKCRSEELSLEEYAVYARDNQAPARRSGQHVGKPLSGEEGVVKALSHWKHFWGWPMLPLHSLGVALVNALSTAETNFVAPGGVDRCSPVETVDISMQDNQYASPSVAIFKSFKMFWWFGSTSTELSFDTSKNEAQRHL